MRKLKEIIREGSEVQDRIWLIRHNFLKTTPQWDKVRPDLRKGALAVAKKVRAALGRAKASRPKDDFAWGRLSGRLETLRWVMGDEWGNLDT